jgi:hypothetical protein
MYGSQTYMWKSLQIHYNWTTIKCKSGMQFVPQVKKAALEDSVILMNLKAYQLLTYLKSYISWDITPCSELKVI